MCVLRFFQETSTKEAVFSLSVLSTLYPQREGNLNSTHRSLEDRGNE